MFLRILKREVVVSCLFFLSLPFSIVYFRGFPREANCYITCTAIPLSYLWLKYRVCETAERRKKTTSKLLYISWVSPEPLKRNRLQRQRRGELQIQLQYSKTSFVFLVHSFMHSPPLSRRLLSAVTATNEIDRFSL